jgi:hypothetical protein
MPATRRWLLPALCIKDKEMTTCLVRLKGKNFLIDENTGPRKKSFRSSRLVDAENQEKAESIVRESVSNDPRNNNYKTYWLFSLSSLQLM